MALLGWCMTGQHITNPDDDPRPRCPGTRNWKGKPLNCTCHCHGGSHAPTTLRETDESRDGDPVPVSESAG